MKIPIVYLVLIIQICCYSQQIAFPKIVPPSPTAYELGKYGQVPVGMFTGTPNVSLPLYTYRSQNLSVPMSLSYSSNGIKVDQLASSVGLGWSLNVGGVITRIVRDKPDEERGVFIPDHDIHEVGFFTPEVMDFLYATGEEGADTETDLYMYNFMGHSGKFVFENRMMVDENDNGLIMMPQTDLKVNVVTEGFKVTTPDGVVYSFFEKESTRSRIYPAHGNPEVVAVTSWYLSKIEHPKGDYIDFIYDESNMSTYDIASSDALIVSIPYFQDSCIGVNSGVQNISNITTKLSVAPKILSRITSNNPENGEVFFEANFSHPEISSLKLITRIVVKNNDIDPETKAQFDFTYDPTENERVLLDKVQFLDPEKNYWFEYYNPDEMPERLSKRVDYFGYYNNINNDNKYRFPKPDDPMVKDYIHPQFFYYSLGDEGSDKSIVPSEAQNGLLKKVHYPTGGYNEFEYEANDYRDIVTVYPNDHNESVNLLAISEFGDSPQVVEDLSQTERIVFDQLVKFKLTIGLPYDVGSPCHSSPPTHVLQARLRITDELNNNIPIMTETVNGLRELPNNTMFQTGYPSLDDYYYVEFKKDKIYTISLSTVWKCTETYTNIVYRSSDTPYNESQNIITGGMRIKRIKSFDTPTSLIPNNSMRYYYGEKDSLHISSGQKGLRPYYVTKSTYRDNCGGYSFYDITSQSLNSNSVRQLYRYSDIGTTTYRYVTVSYGGDDFEGGGIENEYIIMDDVQGNPIHGDPIDGSPMVNAGWGNGLLKKELVFKKEDTEFVPLKETINSYKSVDSAFSKVYGYTVNKMFEFSDYIDITYECTYDDTTKRTKEWYCDKNHSHIWVLVDLSGWGGSDGRNCIAPGANMVYRWISVSPCFGVTLPHTVIYPRMLDNLNIMEYTNNSYWFFQDSSTTKEYDDDGNFTQIATRYYYDNPKHLQQTRVEKTTSTDNKKLIIRTDYADDLGVQGLIDDYRIAEPVQVRSFKKEGESPEQLLTTQITEYDYFDGLYLPKFIKTLKGEAHSAQQLESRIIYHSYDGYGNPRELSKVGGAHTSYIWGYYGRYPVAKVENATYAQAVGVGGLNMSIIEDPSTGDLNAELDKIRDGLPNALVTTLTYLPLVGVHTVTDPKGYKMTYEYDEFGRLQYVKDAEGNVLSENQYHYLTD